MSTEVVADAAAPSAPARPSARIPHQPALDGLRGVAVLLVVVYHDGLLRTHPAGLLGGFLGVDVFFVLSGFLITALLLAEHGSSGRIALRSFWARRARRLLPALFLLLLGVALYCAVLAGPAERAQTRGDAIATLLYFQNWHLTLWHRSRAGSLLDHAWSLSVEEQWYLFWPVLIGAVLAWRRAAPRRVFAIIVALTAVAAVWAYGFSHSVRHQYYGTDTRAAEFLVGACLAIALRYRAVVSAAARWSVEVAGLVGCVVATVLVITSRTDSKFLPSGGSLVFSVAIAAIIAAAVQPSSKVVRPLFSFRALRWAGLISYGLYLYHWPLDFWLSSARLHMSGIPLSIVRLVVALAVSTASLVLVERPIRRGALRGQRLRTATIATLVVVVVATFAATRVPSSTLISPEAVSSLQHSAKLPGRRVLVVGHGLAYQLQLADGSYHERGLNGVVNSFFDCSFIPGDLVVPSLGTAPEAPHCSELLRSLRELRRAFRPDVVVLIPGAQELFDRRVGVFQLRVGSTGWTTYAGSELDSAIRALTGSGSTPVVLTNDTCDLTGATSGLHAVTNSPTRLLAVSRFAEAYARAHAANVTFADLSSLFCDNGRPIRSVNGRPIVDARGALTPAGGHYLWDWIAQQVLDLGAK